MDIRGRRSPFSSRGMLPLLAFHAVSEFSRLPRKPPVTAGLLAANTLIYLRPGVFDSMLPQIDEVWFNAHLIVKYRDLKRFLLSAFYHVNEPHLVYNMMSLLWKGIQLEMSMGSTEFASMVTVLVGLSQGITLLLAKSLLLFFDYEHPYYSEYAVGFSGVLFAMKVVLNSHSESLTYTHGIVVPTRYAAWAELILIQMMVPGVSFLGHLGGILAGLVYLKLKGGGSGSDPLVGLVRSVVGVLSWPLRLAWGLFRPRRHGAFGRGSVRGSQIGWAALGTWRCEECTYDNSGWLGVCEMCGTGRNGGRFYGHVSSDRADDLSLDELRRRRVERFGR